MMKFDRVASPARPALTATLMSLLGMSFASPATSEQGALIGESSLGQAALVQSSPPGVALGEKGAAAQAKVLETYLIGPQSASQLGCQIAWQSFAQLGDGGSLKMVASSAEAILAMSNRNGLTLLRPETGDRAWTTSAADPRDKIIGLGVFPFIGREDTVRVGVMTDADFYTLGFDSGATIARSRYKHAPSTPPAHVGKWFIYGTNSGHVSWFNAATGNDSRAHLVNAVRGGGAVTACPAVVGDTVVAGDRDGGVVALGTTRGDFRWKKELLAGVSASPAIGPSAAFVASEDQYLYAFDLGTGATLWKYFTQTPLTTSPFVAGELVLQDVPGEGLVALTQNPESQPGGEVRWKRERVMGTPITIVDNAAAFWCAKCRKVTLVALKDGSILREVSLPSVENLEADTIEEGGFLAWSADGRIERLSPRTKTGAATATAAK